jgi:Isocitrate/isopropylmalate dehydrogenase
LTPVLTDPRAAGIDFVLIRESTEGLFASRGKGIVIDDREARETLVVTRGASERLFRFAFALARSRRNRGRPGDRPASTRPTCLLEWLGDCHQCAEAIRAGSLIRDAVDVALEDGVRPFEFAGTAGTDAITPCLA